MADDTIYNVENIVQHVRLSEFTIPEIHAKSITEELPKNVLDA
jgi:hypothetical protein